MKKLRCLLVGHDFVWMLRAPLFGPPGSEYHSRHCRHCKQTWEFVGQRWRKVVQK